MGVAQHKKKILGEGSRKFWITKEDIFFAYAYAKALENALSFCFKMSNFDPYQTSFARKVQDFRWGGGVGVRFVSYSKQMTGFWVEMPLELLKSRFFVVDLYGMNRGKHVFYSAVYISISPIVDHIRVWLCLFDAVSSAAKVFSGDDQWLLFTFHEPIAKPFLSELTSWNKKKNNSQPLNMRPHSRMASASDYHSSHLGFEPRRPHLRLSKRISFRDRKHSPDSLKTGDNDH